MITPRFTIIYILLALLFPISLHAQTAQEYYNQGLELKKQNKIDEAIKAFQKAVEKDRKFAEAYYEMALLYQSKNTPASRKRAEDAILLAMKNSRNDKEKYQKYLEALAQLSEERHMGSLSRSTWKRVLEEDPKNIEAFEAFARYHEEEIDRYKYRVEGEIKRDKNWVEYGQKYYGSMYNLKDLLIAKWNSMPPIRWIDFVGVDEAMSRAYNDTILAINPDNRDALYRNGILLLDKVKYVYHWETVDTVSGYRPDYSNLDEFIDLFAKLIEKNPEDKDGYLFLGLAYHRQQEYEKAYERFEMAKRLMSDDERAVFEYVGYLKVGGIDAMGLSNDVENKSFFWYQRNPLYLSSYNERQLEHYCRVAEANLRFSIPRKNIEGWQTDQGKMLIKYGVPEARFQERAGDSTSYLIYQSYDFWYYDDISFMFEKPWGATENPYMLGNYGGFNFDEILREEEKTLPELYTYKPKGKFIDFAYDYATFRGEAERTRVEVYYGVPLNKLRFSEEEEYYYGSYRTGVFLHDPDWNRIIGDIQDKDMEYSVTDIDTSSDDLAVDLFEYQVNPGWYHFAIEMTDWYSDNAGTYRDSLIARQYGYDTLQISDVQLALDIQLRDTTGAVSSDNLDITPNPLRFYRINQPLYIYYEIYNLFLSDFPGNTDYTVEYNMDYIGEEKYSIVDFVRRLIVNEKQELGISTIFTRSGRDRDESSFLRIDHSLTKPGPYQLTLKVTDNIAHKTVEKSVVLRLFEEK